MKKKLLMMLFGVLAIGLLCGFAMADTNPDDNYDDELGTGTIWDVVVSEDHYDDCLWDNEFAGSKGWSDDTYVLTWSGGGIEIHCYDRFWYGDFYSVWMVDTGAGVGVHIFTTPEVETDSHHVCSYPYHTGQGSTWSDGTYYMYLNPGTYEFKVRNELFQLLWAEGIDPRTPTPWSPAGFYIGFHRAPHIIPEVPLGTVASAVAMLVGLVGYIGTNVVRRRL